MHYKNVIIKHKKRLMSGERKGRKKEKEEELVKRENRRKDPVAKIRQRQEQPGPSKSRATFFVAKRNNCAGGRLANSARG